MLKAVGNKVQHYLKLHPIMLFLIFLSIGMTTLIILSTHEGRFRMMFSHGKFNENVESYPFHNFRNLVMVAGHSVYTSSSCEKVDKEDAWYLESYQKHPGQAATFIKHIQNGVEITAMIMQHCSCSAGVRLGRMLDQGVKLRVTGLPQSPKDGLVSSLQLCFPYFIDDLTCFDAFEMIKPLKYDAFCAKRLTTKESKG